MIKKISNRKLPDASPPNCPPLQLQSEIVGRKMKCKGGRVINKRGKKG
jgi:hypothetical protein